MSDTLPTARSRPTPWSSQPLPGQHLPGALLADPEQVRAEVDGLLARLADRDGAGRDDTGRDDAGRDDTDRAAAIAHRSEVLDQAHDVLVAALASLDKI